MFLQQYLAEGTPLVNSLMTMTRELRHTGIRIIISTQGRLTLVGLCMSLLLTRLQNQHVFHPSCLAFVELPFCTGSPALPGGNTFRNISLATSPLAVSRPAKESSPSKPGRRSSLLHLHLSRHILRLMARPPWNSSEVGISLLAPEVG